MKRTLVQEIKTANNVKREKKITNINPAVSDAVLIAFSQQLAALTTNTLIGTRKIEESSLM